jgi:hypothetical protein
MQVLTVDISNRVLSWWDDGQRYICKWFLQDWNTDFRGTTSRHIAHLFNRKDRREYVRNRLPRRPHFKEPNKYNLNQLENVSKDHSWLSDNYSNETLFTSSLKTRAKSAPCELFTAEYDSLDEIRFVSIRAGHHLCRVWPVHGLDISRLGSHFCLESAIFQNVVGNVLVCIHLLNMGHLLTIIMILSRQDGERATQKFFSSYEINTRICYQGNRFSSNWNTGNR